MTKIFELQNHILIYTSCMDPAEHRHMAAHIIISMGNQMKVMVNNKEYLCKGICIPSGDSHKIDTCGNPVLVFLYDSTTNVAKHIQKVQEIDDEKCINIISLYEEFEKSSSKADYSKIEKYILEEFGLDALNGSVTDDRIIAGMNYIRKNSNSDMTCKEVADAVFLSEGRFSHLFREQVGMTFAAFLIYQRILNVYANVIRGKTVTEAAIEAGFSSSTHFADVNRRVFGISISNISRDLNYIKVK